MATSHEHGADDEALPEWLNLAALAQALLPQYRLSAKFHESFLDAIHEPHRGPSRAAPTSGKQWADQDEISADVFGYFLTNKPDLEREFVSDLSEQIGTAKTADFCRTIAQDWFAGANGHRRVGVRSLKASIRAYLAVIARPRPLVDFVVRHDQLQVPATLSVPDVIAVLNVNHQMLFKHIEEWKDHHPDHDRFSSDDVFLRRGIALNQRLNTSEPFREWDFINSYSLSVTSPEKFTKLRAGPSKTLVHGDLHLFDKRILFFSPFIPGMQAKQFEFGVIPSTEDVPIKDQGIHGGIHEYILGRGPWDEPEN